MFFNEEVMEFKRIVIKKVIFKYLNEVKILVATANMASGDFSNTIKCEMAEAEATAVVIRKALSNDNQIKSSHKGKRCGCKVNNAGITQEKKLEVLGEDSCLT